MVSYSALRFRDGMFEQRWDKGVLLVQKAGDLEAITRRVSFKVAVMHWNRVTQRRFLIGVFNWRYKFGRCLLASMDRV